MSERWRPGKLLKREGKPLFKERPLLGFLASSPEEIRGFRRGIVSLGISTILIAAYMGTILTKLPEAPTKQA